MACLTVVPGLCVGYEHRGNCPRGRNYQRHRGRVYGYRADWPDHWFCAWFNPDTGHFQVLWDSKRGQNQENLDPDPSR